MILVVAAAQNRRSTGGAQMLHSIQIRSIMAALALAALMLGGGTFAQAALADDCDQGSIIPADGSFVYGLPSCTDGETILIPTAPGAPILYTRPGDTPYVNGAPDFSPYSNFSTMT